MSECTKEPWYASKEDDNWRVMAADENGGYTLADMCCDDQEANARRIVACVNACAGWRTKLLEKLNSAAESEGHAGALEIMADRANSQVATISEQRDAALAVIEQMRVALGVFQKATGYPERMGECPEKHILATALALQPDTSALRKRDAETLRKAAGKYDERGRCTTAELRWLADRIEKGEA